MAEAKISIFRICSDPDALVSRRREIQAVLDGERGVFGEEVDAANLAMILWSLRRRGDGS